MSDQQNQAATDPRPSVTEDNGDPYRPARNVEAESAVAQRRLFKPIFLLVVFGLVIGTVAAVFAFRFDAGMSDHVSDFGDIYRRPVEDLPYEIEE